MPGIRNLTHPTIGDKNAAGPFDVALGVDGGAGRLKFTLLKANGEPVHHETPGANPTLVGMEEFLSRLAKGTIETLDKAGCSALEVRSAGFGLSGVDRPEQIAKVKKTVRPWLLPRCEKIWVGNDALAALAAGSLCLQGMVLIAGTGSICVAVDGSENQFRVGGWGSDLGDEGSAFWIGREAIRSATRMHDGRDGRDGGQAKTQLLDAVLEHTGVAEPMDLIAWAAEQSREAFKQSCAALFPQVAELAERGDEAGDRILDEAVRHLVELVLPAQSWMRERAAPEVVNKGVKADAGPEGDPEIPTLMSSTLVCAGGLFQGGSPANESFIRRFEAALFKETAGLSPGTLSTPPSLGALWIGDAAAPDWPKLQEPEA